MSKLFWWLLVVGAVAQFIMNRVYLGEKIPLLIRNWAFDGVPFFFLGINYTEYKSRFENMPKTIHLGAIFISGILLVLESVLCGLNQEYYGMTIVFAVLVFSYTVEKEKVMDRIIAICGQYYRKYGLVFYIIQVAIIKSGRLFVDNSSIWYQWCEPIISLVFTMLFSFIVVECKGLLRNSQIINA